VVLIKRCDNCDVKLVERDDDTEDIIRDRLKVYENSTLPLLTYFKNINMPMVDFIPYKGVDDYHLLEEKILNIL
jgi:adenylate kinase family enzyme